MDMVSIKRKVPDDCPYILEHILMEANNDK